MTYKRLMPIRVCAFCNQNYTQSNHQPYCKQNPNKKTRITSNQHKKAKERGEKIVVSDETRKKISNAGLGRKHSEASIIKMRAAMQKAVKDYPDSYAGGYNRYRVKAVTCSNGFVVIGKWEQTFVEFCISNNIEIQQPNTGFSYEWNGSTRTYFPDFYLPQLDQWVEIKGYETEIDRAKWDSLIKVHMKSLIVIKQKEIKNLDEWHNTIKRTNLE